MVARFLWHGRLADTNDPSPRNPISLDILRLPRPDGGLALPDIEHAIELQAAKRVLRWVTCEHGHNQLVAEFSLPGSAIQAAPASLSRPTSTAIAIRHHRKPDQHLRAEKSTVFSVGAGLLAEQQAKSFAVPDEWTTSKRRWWARFKTPGCFQVKTRGNS